MATKRPNPSSKSETLKTVKFTCDAPEAKAVLLIGSFDDWERHPTPMKRDKKGQWSVSKRLASGWYEYKFIIDGRCCCEPGCSDGDIDCPKCIPNAFGTMNRVIEVA